MARQTVGKGWLREEQDSTVIQRIAQGSIAETRFKSVTMSGESKTIPRAGTVGVGIVAKGAAYGEDVSAQDYITLTYVKFGTAKRLADEDISDSIVDVINQYKTDWATSYAILFDNATMGTSAAPGAGVPFVSIYRALTTADAAVDYAANANVLTTAGALTYGKLSALAGIVEGSAFADTSRLAYIAHPRMKAAIRAIVDDNGQPIFTASPRQGDPDTLFGYPLLWSQGAVVTATADESPTVSATGGAKGATGNALILFGNLDLAIVGKRSGPESVVIDARDGLSALTDEAILKMRALRGFVVGNVQGWAALELTNA